MKYIVLSFIFFIIKFIICYKIDVNTSSGLVRGQTIQVLNQSIDEFLSIPFAEPPIGDLRFAKPKPIDRPLPGIIDATKAKNSCYQEAANGMVKDFIGNLTVSEDCLVLNVWSQSSNTNSTKLKPVMFWIYGGGLTLGSIFQGEYNGSVLASNDVVLVSANYRLGALGFLFGDDPTAPGNVGFYDQVMALKWVRQNIHLFGGDKDQITIFGQSAGSWSVSAQLQSPESKGLFKRAIMESGAVMFNKDRPVISKIEALKASKEMAKRLNCTDDKTWLKCVRNVSPHEVVDNYVIAIMNPVIGTDFLPDLAQKAFNEYNFNKDLDLLAGVTKNEGSELVYFSYPQFFNKTLTKADFLSFVQISEEVFHNIDIENITEFYMNGIDDNDSDAIKWRIFDFYGDILLACPTYLFTKRYAQHSTRRDNVFFYELTYTADKEIENKFGVHHGADLPFVFGHPLVGYGGPLRQNMSPYTKADIEFSNQIIKYWINFAKYGTPGEDKLGKWKPLMTGLNEMPTLVKDLNPNESNSYFIGLFDKTCEGVWNNYF